MKRHILLDLLVTFMKIGLFTFGGGYAMISMIESCCVEKKKWISHDDMMNITVIAESTPGPIAINCATFMGYEQAGFLGALAATVGIILPSFGVIYGISMLLDNVLEITWIANAFQGIKIAVGILILDVAVTMIKKMPKKPMARLIMWVSFAAMFFINMFHLKFSSIGLMMAAAAVSLAVFAMGGKDSQKDGSGWPEGAGEKGSQGTKGGERK
ncbi:MAG: chromate transporter [Hungatella sp.]|jgi:chromate transporter|nr:chromate transporter [Hungatella sp.]